jgi:hypothetical protein
MGWFVPLAVAGLNYLSGRKSRSQAKKLADRQFEYQQEQDALLEEQKQAYRDITFKNPYANVQNQYAGLQTDFTNLGATAFEGMENRFEDLTVDMKAADFQAQQGQQQRANILQGLRGSAGTSGVAGLAQALAGQGALQAQQISAGIGQQERQNQLLSAKEGSRIEQMQRQATLKGGERARALGMGRENLIAKGATAAEMARMGGDAMLQEAEMSRQATLLGMQYGQSAGANQMYQQASYNQQQAGAYADQMNIQALSTLSDVDFSGSAF